MKQSKNIMKYGEKEIECFDINLEEHYWDNKHFKNYEIKIKLPEFICKCPRSGYPDLAIITLKYIPNKLIIELKALKIYINSFMNRYISHEDAANLIFDILYKNLKPKRLKIKMDFNPRGNVHTIIKLDSKKIL